MSTDTDNHRNDAWSDALIGAFLVQLVTLSGIVLVAASRCFTTTQQSKIVWVGQAAAAGALLATTVFLLLPEALHMLEGGHQHEDDHHDDHRRLEADENEVAWKFGAALLGGFVLPILVKLPTLPTADEEDKTPTDSITGQTPDECGMCELCQEQDEEPLNKTTAPIVVDGPPENWSVALGILVGDFLHNFADGLFIGNAFALCDSSLGYTIVASTIYHELTQELADFWMLTRVCHLSVRQALALNFVSGFSVWLGVVLILQSNISPEGTGVLLALSAGVYLYLAAAECLDVHNAGNDRVQIACVVVGVILGAIPIGLVLLNHGHCEA